MKRRRGGLALDLLRRVPFTAATVAGLLLAATATSSVHRPLSRRRLGRLGFAPRDLASPAWHRLATAAFVTHGGAVLARSTFLTALSVGAAETRHGTARAAVAFWTVHLGTLLSLGTTVLAGRTLQGHESVPELPRDVGPSAGYLGCLGLVCAGLPRGLAGPVSGAVLTALAATPFLPPLSTEGAEARRIAEVAHLLAFPLGLLVAAATGVGGSPGAGERRRASGATPETRG